MMQHLGHQPWSEIRALTLEELFIQVTELSAWVNVYKGNEDDESGLG